MKKMYFFLFALMNVSLMLGQTVEIVADSHEGEEGTAPSNLVANSNFFIYAGKGVNTWSAAKSIMGTIYYYDYSDYELWVSDGSAANTSMLEVNSTFTTEVDAESVEYTQHNSASFTYSVLFNDKVYFSAKNGDGSSHVYYIDGVKGDTVRALNNAWSSRVLVDDANSKVYLTEGSSTPWKLWNGVNLNEPEVLPNQYEEDGVTLKVENSSNGACLLGGKVVFAGDYVDETLDDATGTELFIYDPAGTEGPQLLKDINVGSSNSSPKYYVTYNNMAYFRAADGDGTYALWKTNGTAEGTVRVTPGDATWTVDINSQPFLFDGKLYFEGDDDNSETDALDQLYVYDIDMNTLTRISGLLDAYKAGLETPEEVFINFDPKDYVVLNNTLYFIAKYSYVDGENTYDSTTDVIYKLNGSSVEIVEESKGFYPSDLVVFDSKIYFAGEDPNASLGEELYVFNPNGTANAIKPLAEKLSINVSPNPSYGFVNVTGLNSADSSYELYNLSGQIVEKGIIQNGVINYDVAEGIYLLKVSSEGSFKTFKIIVK